MLPHSIYMLMIISSLLGYKQYSLNPDSPFFIVKVYAAFTEYLHKNPSVLGSDYILWGTYPKTIKVADSPDDPHFGRITLHIQRVYKKHTAPGEQKTFGVIPSSLVPYLSIPADLQLKTIRWKIQNPSSPVSKCPVFNHYSSVHIDSVYAILHRWSTFWKARAKAAGLDILNASFSQIIKTCLNVFMLQFMQNNCHHQTFICSPTQLCFNPDTGMCDSIQVSKGGI